ncbi:hypothetical protein NDU88_001886 [Pleurodeles waltl]|uniref:Uncharacterized protein n=1 Tax=Pleurodeles waltl TaxID=8319 RepID=A0AAV7TJN2_PLEWA|nr:hypothetical protein NDU88_001886 [Pleurodeles waltl]
MVYLSRHSLINAHRGLPGFAVRYSFCLFSVCQGPGLHLQSSGPAACPLVAPPPRRRLALSPSWPRIGPTLSERGDSSGVPRCSRADRPRAASARSPARGQNLLRGSAPVFSGGHPLQKRRFAAPRLGASLLGLPGPLWHHRGRGETRPESPAVFGTSALMPHRVAAPRKAAASAACPGLRPLISPMGRFRPPAPSGVATGARSRPATSVSSAPPLGP